MSLKDFRFSRSESRPNATTASSSSPNSVAVTVSESSVFIKPKPISSSPRGIICFSLRPSMASRLFFLIVTACCASVLPCSLCFNAQYEYCINTGSTCGNITFKYPFGIGNRGCGLPSFQMDCVQNSSPVITIHSWNYTILKYFSHSFLIARGDNCQFLDHPLSMQISSSRYADAVFNIAGKENRTLSMYNCNQLHDLRMQLSKCNASVYWGLYDPGYPIAGCSLEKHVVVEVGKMKWPVTNNTKRDDSCRSCQVSHGICGYNVSESTKPFVCYCKDGPRTHECPAHSHRTAIIIGCSTGVALTAIALVLFLTFYVKKKKARPWSSTSKVEKFLKEYAYEVPTRYTHSQLKKITNNFAENLGEGGYGVVYKGKLRSNEALVAVKILDRHRHSETQFMNEVATVGRVHHVNLVRLLGYCFESPISALVYEYMVNGSLDKFLFARNEEEQAVLRWEQLYSIALGAARGIAYLHQDCEKRIIHFDIKPANILLDTDFTPKVSDFGMAMLSGKGDDHVSMTTGRGTPGYVAPEVCNKDMGPVTDKSDVYSFGMLLLEIVGGRKNIDVQVSRSSQLYFPEWAFKMLVSEESAGMRLGGIREGEIEAGDEEKTRRLMTKVGLWCIQYNYRDRPCMGRVVQMLEGNGDDVANPPFTLNSSSASAEIPFLSSTGETSSIEIKL